MHATPEAKLDPETKPKSNADDMVLKIWWCKRYKGSFKKRR
jgi:hypothetical protein